jgi:hypothetical protein
MSMGKQRLLLLLLLLLLLPCTVLYVVLTGPARRGEGGSIHAIHPIQLRWEKRGGKERQEAEP